MNSPIRIAHIIGKWLGGGVEAVVMNYYRHIDRSKFQFDFICDSDSTRIPYKEIEALGGKVIIVPPYQKLFSYIAELKKIFLKNNYQIVHSHITTLSVFPLYAAKCAKVPIRICHSHSTSSKKEWKKNIYKNLLRPFSKLYATNYLCCSKKAGIYLFGKKAYNEGKVFLLKNAIEVERFLFSPQIREKKRNELNLQNQTLVFGHIGRFVKQKNQEMLIKIFYEIQKTQPDSVLLLVGSGPEEEKCKSLTEKLCLKNVRFLGQRNDVQELYQAFDAVILPSLYEGLVVVLIEAQCASLPCFASLSITEETKISDFLEFISLKESPKMWAKKILSSLSTFTRKSSESEIKIHSEQINKSGYNILVEVKNLENFYQNALSTLL